MYFKKIKIKNFQSYYDLNSADLDNNLNLFLGTIGAGKSKLFNAFFWCFFGSIYKYEEKWVDITSANFLSIFNKKALKNAEINEKVKVEVTLTIQAEKLYKVSHSIEICKENEENYNSEKNWKFVKEELCISFDNIDGNHTVLENLQAREYIDKKTTPTTNK
ncbi:MAG: AAA family ATPase [Bacteroides sp.]|nr:AAA family ATPase [Bacteroides sp.]